MIWLIVSLVVAPLIVCGIYNIIKGYNGNYCNYTRVGKDCLAGAICIIVLVGSIHFTAYTVNNEKVATLEAFAGGNYAAYNFAVSEAESYFSSEEVGAFLLDGSIEKTGLACSVSERLSEFRDKVVWYNEELAKLNKWNSYFLFGDFIPDTDHLKYIIIEEN